MQDSCKIPAKSHKISQDLAGMEKRTSSCMILQKCFYWVGKCIVSRHHEVCEFFCVADGRAKEVDAQTKCLGMSMSGYQMAMYF